MNKMIMWVAIGFSIFSAGARAEVIQADVNLDFGRFAGFWVYDGC